MIPPMRLQGRVAAITGGALGIGRATALLFAEEGATVALGDVQLEAAEKVAQEIGRRGGKAVAIGLDVGDPAQVQAFVDRVVAEFGRLDVMFANAGIAHSAPFIWVMGGDYAGTASERTQPIQRPSGTACCA